MGINNLLQNLLQLLLANVEVYLQLQEILGIASIHKSQILRKNFIENKTSQCRLYIAGNYLSTLISLRNTHCNSGMQGTGLILISKNCFVYTLEELSFAYSTGSLLGQVVNT